MHVSLNSSLWAQTRGLFMWELWDSPGTWLTQWPGPPQSCLHSTSTSVHEISHSPTHMYMHAFTYTNKAHVYKHIHRVLGSRLFAIVAYRKASHAHHCLSWLFRVSCCAMPPRTAFSLALCSSLLFRTVWAILCSNKEVVSGLFFLNPLFLFLFSHTQWCSGLTPGSTVRNTQVMLRGITWAVRIWACIWHM